MTFLVTSTSVMLFLALGSLIRHGLILWPFRERFHRSEMERLSQAIDENR
jgi:hypothetical protein